MIVASLDRAEKAENGSMHTKPIIKLVASQKNVATAAGVAFWNTYEAMGGEGTMAKWVQPGRRQRPDPSPQGAEIIGDLFYKARLPASRRRSLEESPGRGHARSRTTT